MTRGEVAGVEARGTITLPLTAVPASTATTATTTAIPTRSQKVPATLTGPCPPPSAPTPLQSLPKLQQEGNELIGLK